MALSGQGTISVEWCLVVLTLNLIVLRLVNRCLIQRDRINIGDVLLAFAWVGLMALAACDTWLLKLGFLDPSRSYNDDLTRVSEDAAKNIQVLKIIFGSAVPYYLSLWSSKGALLSFYYTIIPSSLLAYRKALHIVTGTAFISLLVVLCLNFFWCMPIPQNWHLNDQPTCFSFTALPVFVVSTALDITTNIAIFILPFPLFRNIKIQHRSQLIGLIAIFSIGCFVMLASVVRVAILADVSTTTHVAVWSVVEVAVGIVVATLPALRSFLRKPPSSLNSLSGSGCSDSSGASNLRKSTGRQNRPDWICLEEGDVDSTRNKNRDTIKSHSTGLTVPTIEELDEIVCEKEGTPPVRSINDLQRFHDSILFHRDPADFSTGPAYEWSFDKVQWRYTDPLPPSPITVNGLGVIPDISAPPTTLRGIRSIEHTPAVPPVPILPKLHQHGQLQS